MMKRYLKKIFAVAGAAVTGCTALTAQTDKGFVLHGFVPGMPDSVRVELADCEGEKIKILCDTTHQDGHFVLEGRVDGPTFCNLRFTRYNPFFQDFAPVVRIRMFVENGDISFRSEQSYDSLCNSYQPELLVSIRNGKAQEQYMEATKVTAETALKAQKAGYLEANKYFDSNVDPDTVRKYTALTKAAEAEAWAVQRKFLLEHPAYHISAYWTEKELEKQFVYDETELHTLADAVAACPDTARTARIGKKLIHALQYATGRKYTDFEATTPDNTKKMLSDVINPGRFTLVDFWASWCGPCRSAIPKVEKLYKQYDGKLQVCSVSLDEKEENWRKAMEDEKMPWPQLWTNREQMNAVFKGYMITSIPRLMLFNEKGEIICSTFSPDEIANSLNTHLSHH